MKKALFLVFLFSFITIRSQEQQFEVFNTSINSSYAELGVSFMNNGLLLFASSKKDKTEKNFSKSRRRNNQQLFLDLYVGSILENGDIREIQKFSNEKNNKIFESDVSITPNGKTIYFTWNNYYNTQKRRDSAKWKTLHIMKGDFNSNYEISAIEPIPINNKKYSVRSPELSSDGKKLFFISDMPGGLGGFDVYYVNILPNNTFSQPINLGANVNTEKHELYPFVDDNNNLYFSSYGRDGLGSLDIYKSTFTNNEYSVAENLKAPINSKYDDFAFVINTTTNKGYFTSNRRGGSGDVDIYAFTPKIAPCNQQLIVNVVNKNNNNTIPNTVIHLYENNTLKSSQNSTLNKDLTFKLKCDTAYRIVAESNDFESDEISFNTSTENNVTLEKELYLVPLSCEQTIAGFIKNKKSNAILNNINVSLFKNDSLVKSQFIAQENNGFRFKLACNSTYKIIVEGENFLESEILVNTSSTRNNTIKKDVFLTPMACNQTYAFTFVNEETGEVLSNVKSVLSTNTKQLNSMFSNEFGISNMNVECEKNFRLNISKNGFEPQDISFESSNTRNQKFEQTIALKPIKCEPLVTGIVLDEETNLPLSNAAIEVSSNNTIIASIETNSLGEFEFIGACRSEYKITASLNDYKNNSENLTTNSDGKNSYFKEIKLKSSVEFVTTESEKMIKTNPIYFDLDSDRIRPDAKIELNKVIGIMIKYPEISIEVRSHTDSRAPDSYNMTLSEKRANSTMRYIISQGIDSDRISGKGFGETKLVNECSNGVKCTKEQHEVNRRTEFVIVNN